MGGLPTGSADGHMLVSALVGVDWADWASASQVGVSTMSKWLPMLGAFVLSAVVVLSGLPAMVVMVGFAWLLAAIYLVSAMRRPPAHCPNRVPWRNSNFLMGCGWLVLASGLQWGTGLSRGPQWLLAIVGLAFVSWGFVWLRRATVRIA